MTNLKICQPPSQPLRPCDGTWGSLAAWFLEFVTRLDKGDLVAATECQNEIEKHGFKITYRGLPRKEKGAVR